MPSLIVEVEAGTVDWHRWSTVVPPLIDRVRSIRFDDDGVAHLPEGRREGLRLTHGEPDRPGRGYRLVTVGRARDPQTGLVVERLDPPSDIVVEADDAAELTLLIATAEFRARVTLPEPVVPQLVNIEVDVALPDLPRWIGDRLSATGTLTLTTTNRPRLIATGTLGRIRGDALLEIVAGQPTERLRARLVVRASGPLAALSLIWPFLRGRARREVEHGLSEVWTTIDRELGAAPSIDELVENLWVDLVSGIAEHVPADSGPDPA